MSELNNKPNQLKVNHDEIDFLDLINTLWTSKFLIVSFAVLGFLSAYAATLLMKEEWRSTAMVVAPRLNDTEELIAKNRTIQRIVNPDEDIVINELMEKVFNTFLYTAADNDEKQHYLQQTELFKRLQQDNYADNATLLNALSQNLSVQLPDEKAPTLTSNYTLSFVSDSAESAQQVLDGYITNINRIAIETTRQEFRNNLASMIAIRKQQINDIERDLQNSRQVTIDTYTDALLVAQKAGIKSALNSLSEHSDLSNNLVLEINANPQQLYLQGEEVIQALLDVAKTTPLSYPTNFYRLQYEIEALEPILEEKSSFQTFSYLMRPKMPPKRTAPKRTKTAAIGGLIGAFLASLLVLALSSVRNRQKRLRS